MLLFGSQSCHDVGLFSPHINIATAFGFNNLKLPRSLVKSFIFSLIAKGEMSTMRMAAHAISPSRTQTALRTVNFYFQFGKSERGYYSSSWGPLRRKKKLSKIKCRQDYFSIRPRVVSVCWGGGGGAGMRRLTLY